jgi:TNF receptor-associated protein 1
MLISKLRNIVTKRVLKMISEEATKNESLYLSWYNDFQFFLKEGLATDQDNQDAIM